MDNANTERPETEFTALRRELALRILLQNLLLLLSLVLFSAFAVLAALEPETSDIAAVLHGVVVLGASLQWCHHGIRTRQIKHYLVADAALAPWESWLPANRPRTLLGSRWMISTKGVFLGLQVAMIGLAVRLAPAPDLLARCLALGLLATTAGFLLTNPKE